MDRANSSLTPRSRMMLHRFVRHSRMMFRFGRWGGPLVLLGPSARFDRPLANVRAGGGAIADGGRGRESVRRVGARERRRGRRRASDRYSSNHLDAGEFGQTAKKFASRLLGWDGASSCSPRHEKDLRRVVIDSSVGRDSCCRAGSQSGSTAIGGQLIRLGPRPLRASSRTTKKGEVGLGCSIGMALLATMPKHEKLQSTQACRSCWSPPSLVGAPSTFLCAASRCA